MRLSVAKLPLFALLALLPLQACESDELPVYGYRIVNVFPHDENAFTQGLFFRDGWLYESTGKRGASSVRKVHIDTGRVGQQYDFEHRYTVGYSDHVMPADLPPAQTDTLQKVAVAAHRALGCRDLSRADFVVTDDEIYLLEVNTLPGMTPTSLYPDGARGYGLAFPELVKHLALRACSR